MSDQKPNYALRRLLVIGGAFVVMVAIIAWIDPSPSSGSGQPTTIQDVDPAIAQVDIAAINMNVWLDFEDRVTDPVLKTALIVERLGEALQGGVAGPTSETAFVQVIVRGTTIDRLGQKRQSKHFQMRFAIDDLRRAKFENLEPTDILNLADKIHVRAGGVAAVKTFCNKNAGSADAFCRQAL